MIIQIFLILVCAAIAWAVVNWLPLPAGFPPWSKNILYCFILILLLLYFLGLAGVLGTTPWAYRRG